MMACWPCHCRTEQTYFDSDPATKSFPVSPKANPQVSASTDSEAAAAKNGSDVAAAETASEAVTPVQMRVMMMPLRRQSPPPESEPRTRANNPESAPLPAPCWKAKPTGDVPDGGDPNLRVTALPRAHAKCAQADVRVPTEAPGFASPDLAEGIDLGGLAPESQCLYCE